MSSRVMSSLKDADTGIMVVPSSTRTVEGGMPAASSASPTVDPAGMSTSWLPSKPSNRIRMIMPPCTTLMWPAWDASSASRDRIARYCGGFEIHCPMDAGVRISLSAPRSHVEMVRGVTEGIDMIDG